MPINSIVCKCGARLNYVVGVDDFIRTITCTRCGAKRAVDDGDVNKRVMEDVEQLASFSKALHTEGFIELFEKYSAVSVEDSVRAMEEKFSQCKDGALSVRIKPTRSFKGVSYSEDIAESASRISGSSAHHSAKKPPTESDSSRDVAPAQIPPRIEVGGSTESSARASEGSEKNISEIAAKKMLVKAGLAESSAEMVIYFIQYLRQRKKENSERVNRSDIAMFAKEFGFDAESVDVVLSLYDSGIM